jgi:putative alpha-1,2-mannosidase
MANKAPKTRNTDHYAASMSHITEFLGKFIKKNPTRCNNVPNFIIPYLYEAQHVSGDTPPIIKSLKL